MTLRTPTGRTIPMPAEPGKRRLLGWGLVAGGILGFFPVAGFWMLPLGLVVLSVDSPRIRHTRRRLTVWCARRWPRKAD